MKEIIERADAISLGLRRYYTGRPCKHGHFSERKTNGKQCCACISVLRKTSAVHKEYQKKYQKIYKEIKEGRRPPTKPKKRQKIWDERAWYREYRKRNKDKILSYNSRSFAARLQRLPSWADIKKIQEIYAYCRRVSEETGIKHHVDHEIPLRGKNVSGLHVHYNLRVITAEENVRKSNKYYVTH